MAFCSICGTQLSDGSNFCPKCGQPISTASKQHADASEQLYDTAQQHKNAFEISEKGNSPIKKILSCILLAFVALCVIGYCSSHSNSGSDNNSVPTITEDTLQIILNGLVSVDNAEEKGVNRFCTERFVANFKEACEKAEKEGYEYPRLWWQYSDSDPEKYEIVELDMKSNSAATAKVKILSEMYVGTFTVSLKYENNSWLVDDITEIGTNNNPDLASSTTENNYDWLQGHWVYERGNYKGHFIIEGNTITQFSSMNPEHESRTFSIDGDVIRASIIDGMELVVKIDFENRRIDYGDGQWMHKTDSSSDDSYSSDDVNTSSSRTFLNVQYVVGYLANQTFRSSDGFKIWFDGNGGMYSEGDYAGIVSVLQYTPTSALLRYGGGQYDEGKILVKIVGHKLQLIDPVDGTVFYQ